MRVELRQRRGVERVLLRAEGTTDVSVVGLLVHAFGWEVDPTGEGCWIPEHLTVPQVEAALRSAVGTRVLNVH